MRLKSLRLSGFKSFADRTEFQFPKGITCVVGPNGCGKSNVVDAMKWVLGEQRPGALRGAEMSDVIFGGTAARRALGACEVTLVLDNSERSVPLDFEEIEVTRRLYRDGQSEYLLNRSTCRLRDLRELLMDTGSGPGAMSVMEQGKIDAILRESVEERRSVFEEAAGIAKYKARRRESLRKLEKVEADLLRVTDVVSEKDRLVRSLRIQAGRAERYQALLDEMKAKRLVIALHRYGRLLEERGAAAERVVSLSAAEEQARDQVREALEISRKTEDELETRRQAISRKEQETATFQGQADTAREKSVFATRLAAELDGKIRWYVGEIESSVARLQDLERARGDAQERISAAEAERADRQRAVSDAERTAEGARSLAHERRTAAQQVAQRAYDNLSKQSRLGAQRSRLDAEAQSLADRDARLRRRAGSLDDDLAAAERRKSAAETERDGASAARESASVAVAAGERRAQETESRIRTLREAAQTIDREVSGTRSRIDVLRALEARMEGVGEGPKRYIEARRRGDSQLPAVRGLLAEFLDVDPAVASEVETALGAHAQALVVDTFETAGRAVVAVRERKLPRCIFLPLDVAAAAAEPAGASVGGRLLDAVRCPDDIRPAVAAILGDAVAVRDLAEARAVRAARPSVRAVLPDGTLVDVSGAISGGGAAGGAGLLQRRSELRDLGAKLDESLARLESARADLSGAESLLQEARRETATARESLRAAEAVFHRSRAEAERAGTDAAKIRTERGGLDREAAEIASQAEKVRTEAARVAEEAARAAADQAELEKVRLDSAKKLEQAESALRSAEERRSDARVQLASVSERCASLGGRLHSIARQTGELEENVAAARSELAECEARRAEAEERGREANRAFESAQRSREACVQELAILRHEASASHSALEQSRSLLGRLESEAAKVAHELHRFRMQENEARLRVENLIERVRDELQADLAEAWEKRRAASASGGDGDTDGATPPVYAVSGAPTAEAIATMETEVVDLKQKIEKMGAVNLEALGQLQAAEKEAAWLRAQYDDLTKSRETLLQAIRKIDQESRVLFEQTFAVIRANFQEMFRRLFGGGRADVWLTEGQDVLEAGIEVVAKPPGKDQRSITLLSGGERTMTAIALLFAIYQARPSPFCLMDEVDAALDEGNIDRFVGVLREFARESQFVIVSHNKRTISAAGTIFGVSMPEPGVSRKIAVRLEDIADDGQLAPRAAAVG